jgi:hypothetical protein
MAKYLRSGDRRYIRVRSAPGRCKSRIEVSSGEKLRMLRHYETYGRFHDEAGKIQHLYVIPLPYVKREYDTWLDVLVVYFKSLTKRRIVLPRPAA